MNEFVQQFSESVRDDSFIQLVLSSPVKDVEPTAHKVSARPVELSSGRAIQFTRHEPARETHQNFALPDAAAEVDRLFGTSFRHAHLFTTDADVMGKQRASGKLKVSRRAPTRQKPASVEHNRSKQHLIPDGVPCPFLIEIGVMSAAGRVRAAKYDKFRQVNRFLEFVEDVYPSLPPNGELRVIDFGCGKSYLTFAMHHLLAQKHGRKVQMLGVDLKQDVIDDCRGIAERLGCVGLEFKAADVADIQPPGPVDLVVSLHACDTATDVALARAVAWQSQAILSVPCCHHEFAAKMTRDVLLPIQQHGILRERFAELATDAYRAQMLEAHGYRAQVVEFIDLEHTARNLLIRAVRRPNDEASVTARTTANQLVEQLGINDPALAQLSDAITLPDHP
ncbi:MAG: class I SAM-dependent methyltransferase [Planctomycetota bacterium]|jgi:SAM-dependent methyltransferase